MLEETVDSYMAFWHYENNQSYAMQTAAQHFVLGCNNESSCWFIDIFKYKDYTQGIWAICVWVMAVTLCRECVVEARRLLAI